MDQQIPKSEYQAKKCYSCEYFSGNRHIDETNGCLSCKQRGYCSQKDKGMSFDSACNKYRLWSIILLSVDQEERSIDSQIVAPSSEVSPEKKETMNEDINVFKNVEIDKKPTVTKAPPQIIGVVLFIIFFIIIFLITVFNL